MKHKKSVRNGLLGKFFHSFSEQGELCWQGHILAEPKAGIYLVELFDWVVGAPSDQLLIPFERMASWRFYDSCSAMNSYYEIHRNTRLVGRPSWQNRPNTAEIQ